ncbi:metallo-peptidase, Clan ME, Family M16, putative [Trypanosoma brucei gambiense DAL972]|uniref:Metallo-peptidase, Clan ME, Family M16, putative n=2 Tax=Trypanosoma brucei TaxID=5691 RepID=C9ZJC5_TRYB9|nr:metallo-peptidase, Clan ME, Family M16, putative [Trypanosoma brucei gambiense DAL972]RHW74165.1 metallo-peptidase [Trypanosoma brucei equiperdum]CBH09484.1 metallo-peptidase, Clan ME, Family M16, putative [Trypanosoma brucei gambiense DAL972]|eukprot:XP_011771789.1 metallo-peptidase, Clan ME, Family M16, putative [Trypanosoma brucei gambiense DAL972]
MLRHCIPRLGIAKTVIKDNYSLSTLTNGLRVLTCDDGNGVTGMGLFMLNGAKFESPDNAGAAAVFEALPLRDNQIYTSREISQALSGLGNAFKVTNNKEALSVILMLPRYHQRDGLELLNAMCLHPTRNEEEFRVAKEKTHERTLLYDRDATSVCFELVHEAGWNGKGLGHSLNPKKEELDKLTLEKFTAFHSACTRPERTVLAATGVADHKSFAEEVEKLLRFNNADVAVQAMPQLQPGYYPYTGGSRLVHRTEAPESVNKFQEKSLSHVALFFQGVPINHPDYYNISVIQTLLGGGTSFSSGGPGKGMQTKLFREVLNREGFLHGLECITAWYSDGGLFGLYGTAPHQAVVSLLNVMIYQAASICQRVSPTHLEMAKNQLRSQLILLGEGREQLLSDMGFNLVVHNHIITATETMEGTRNITLDDLKRVCADMIKKPLTFTVYGDTTKMPSHESLEETVRKTYEKLN